MKQEALRPPVLGPAESSQLFHFDLSLCLPLLHKKCERCQHKLSVRSETQKWSFSVSRVQLKIQLCKNLKL